VAPSPGSEPRTPAGAGVSALVQGNALPEAPSLDRLTIETDIRPQPMDTAAASSEPPGAAEAGSVPSSTARPPAGSAVPVALLDRSFWLQLGAFGSPDNAHAARERFGRQITGLGAPLDVVSDGGLYKLQAGPWPTREAALAAAERVRAMTELKPFTMQR
jgi:rare lipoprotein A